MGHRIPCELFSQIKDLLILQGIRREQRIRESADDARPMHATPEEQRCKTEDDRADKRRIDEALQGNLHERAENINQPACVKGIDSCGNERGDEQNNGTGHEGAKRPFDTVRHRLRHTDGQRMLLEEPIAPACSIPGGKRSENTIDAEIPQRHCVSPSRTRERFPAPRNEREESRGTEKPRRQDILLARFFCVCMRRAKRDRQRKEAVDSLRSFVKRCLPRRAEHAAPEFCPPWEWKMRKQEQEGRGEHKRPRHADSSAHDAHQARFRKLREKAEFLCQHLSSHDPSPFTSSYVLFPHPHSHPSRPGGAACRRRCSSYD